MPRPACSPILFRAQQSQTQGWHKSGYGPKTYSEEGTPGPVESDPHAENPSFAALLLHFLLLYPRYVDSVLKAVPLS